MKEYAQNQYFPKNNKEKAKKKINKQKKIHYEKYEKSYRNMQKSL